MTGTKLHKHYRATLTPRLAQVAGVSFAQLITLVFYNYYRNRILIQTGTKKLVGLLGRIHIIFE